MEKENALEELLNESGIKKTLEELKAYDKFSESEIYSLLLTLALLSNADSTALKYITPIYEAHKSESEVVYWYASALIFAAESFEEYVNAKGVMLDALNLGLSGEMEKDALRKLEFVESAIADFLV